MKKLKAILLFGILSMVLFITAGCGSESTSESSDDTGSNQSGETIEWEIASIYNDPKAVQEYNSLGMSQQKFVDLVNERSNGKLVIKPYYNSVLGGNVELFQKVRRGELEIFFGQPLSGADERFGVWNVPYLFENLDQIEKVVGDPNGEFMKLANEWMADHNLKMLAMGAGSMRGLANTKHTVKSVEDVKDLKLRIYQDPVVDIFWSGISNAQQLPFAEVYTALETGTVDGLEFPATSILSRKFDEIAKYYTDINWQWSPNANIIVSGEKWDELPDDLKEIVQQAAVEAMKYQGELEKESLEKAYEALEANGVEVTRLTDEERKGWVNYARSLDDEIKEAVGKEEFEKVLQIIESSK